MPGELALVHLQYNTPEQEMTCLFYFCYCGFSHMAIGISTTGGAKHLVSAVRKRGWWVDHPV